jgi:hypothetical protein
MQWLLERALKQHAETAPISHFLLDALISPTSKNRLVAWNADIHQYRAVLTNKESAPCKAEIDLKSDGSDAEDKLLSFMAEVMAVITLSRMGYKKFEVLIPSDLPVPDFAAEDPAGVPTQIEVKNLREPEDIVRTVAAAQWRKRSEARPGRYNFKAVLSHSHRGSLSSAATKRLRSIIDLLPRSKRAVDEVLDGGVHIRVEKAQEYVRRLGPHGAILNKTILKQAPDRGLLVVSTITANFASDISEIQSLFLKSCEACLHCPALGASRRRLQPRDIEVRRAKT